MPLIIAPLDTELKIVRVCADEAVKKHLASLGITVNQTIKILQSNAGSVVLLVKEGRLALDNQIAAKIMVA